MNATQVQKAEKGTTLSMQQKCNQTQRWIEVGVHRLMSNFCTSLNQNHAHTNAFPFDCTVNPYAAAGFVFPQCVYWILEHLPECPKPCMAPVEHSTEFTRALLCPKLHVVSHRAKCFWLIPWRVQKPDNFFWAECTQIERTGGSVDTGCLIIRSVRRIARPVHGISFVASPF